MKPVRGRILLILALIIFFGIHLLPSTPFYAAFPEWWKQYLPDRGITLGLDLRGGTHLVLEVEEDRAVESLLDRITTNLRALMAERGIAGVEVRLAGTDGLALTVPDELTKTAVLALMDEQVPQVGLIGEEALVLRYRLRDAMRVRDQAISQALETIRNRIDQFGVAEPLIQRQARNEIVVQLPGVKDSQRAVDLIGKTALLEFKMIEEQADLSQALEGAIPPGTELLYERIVDPVTGQVNRVPHLVEEQALLTGDVITDARVQLDEFNQPYVSIRFDPDGARAFEQITGDHVSQRMAIILDDTIYSAPVIRERISGGNAQISGGFTVEDANDLAIVLRAGALPAPVKIIQNLTVGPSLGQDSITKGLRATVIAGLAVVLFIVTYYRLSGLVAVLALLLNIFMLAGALALLGATLTLPGIAGIALAVGIGVDSNVLILERVREELRQGKPVRLAVDAGYQKAFLTIVDSHVTTLITSLALFLFGTGPIKGFAVSLSLGVGINLFTVLVGTRVVYDAVLARWRPQRLSI